MNQDLLMLLAISGFGGFCLGILLMLVIRHLETKKDASSGEDTEHSGTS